jgi:hypothetical protein
MDRRLYNQLVRERDGLRRGLISAFLGKLRAGTLVATGYVFPLQPDAKPIRIPAEHWTFLRPNFRKCSAEGGGLRLIGVRVRSADADQDATGIVPEELPVETQRAPGRPTLMPEIKEEMKRRWKSGKLDPNFSAECRALAAWSNEKHPERTYEWDNLRKPLRSLYHDLKRGKK